MRNYRQIGKPTSYLQGLGSGQSQGIVTNNSFMETKLTVYHNGNTYSGKDLLNHSFLSAITSFIDLSGLGANDAPAGTVYKIKKFSLVEDSKNTLYEIYNEALAEIPVSNLAPMSVSLYSNKIIGNGIVTKSGTVRAAGFDLASRNSPIRPSINRPVRFGRFKLNNPTGTPSNLHFVYNFNNGYFYSVPNFESRAEETNKIYRFKYDIDTGVTYALELVTDQWVSETPISFYSYSGTNIKDKIIYIGYHNVSSFKNAMYIFDLNTEQVEKILLPYSFDHQPALIWNVNKNCLVSYQPTRLRYGTGSNVIDSNGIELYLNGTISLNTGLKNVTTGNFTNDEFVYTNGSWYRDMDNQILSMSTLGSNSGSFFIENDELVTLLCRFDVVSGVEYLTLTYMERSASSVNLTNFDQEFNVTVGDSIYFEYEMNLIRGEKSV